MILFRYSYRNLWVRRLTTALTASGMGLVVFVFAAVLMLANGLEKALVSTGSKDNVVFIRRSSETEVQSIIERQQAYIVESLSEIKIDSRGRRLVSPESVILIGLNKRSTGSIGNVTVRGVDPDIAFEMRPQVRLAAGRELHRGTSEIVVGKNLVERFAVGGLGQTISFGTRSWTIVGIMDAAGAGYDSEIWADLDLLMATFRRPVYSSIVARLNTPKDFPSVRDRVLSDPRLTVEAWREAAYYASQSELMVRFIRILGIALTCIFSLGAIIGAMVTMYAAVAHRVAEIGTLRALGFQRWTILTAFLAESIFLSLIGGAMGLLGAACMNHLTISTMNWQTFSELSFRFMLTWRIALYAQIFSVVMGTLGGLLPAIRASRLNIVAALRLS